MNKKIERDSVRAVISRKKRFVAALLALEKLLDKLSRSGEEYMRYLLYRLYIPP